VLCSVQLRPGQRVTPTDHRGRPETSAIAKGRGISSARLCLTWLLLLIGDALERQPAAELVAERQREATSVGASEWRRVRVGRSLGRRRASDLGVERLCGQVGSDELNDYVAARQAAWAVGDRQPGSSGSDG
jgi:hypothetical protein